MRGRAIALAVFSGVFAATCLLLGVWQLERRKERRAQNAALAARLTAAPVSFAEAMSDSLRGVSRRVVLKGRYDFAHELILMNRTRRGAPGVNILTPFRLGGHDTAVLVNRGWVYSPDGATVSVADWRAGVADSAQTAGGSEVEAVGLIMPFIADDSTSAGNAAVLRDTTGHARLPQLSRGGVRGAGLPFPVAPVYVQLIPLDTAVREGVPVPVPMPTLSSGPHLSYAIQWFSFALIAVVGTWIVLRRRAGQSERATEL